jgi:hypothetical protein
MKKSTLLETGQKVRAINDEYVPEHTEGVIEVSEDDISGFPYKVDFGTFGKWWVGQNDVKTV